MRILASADVHGSQPVYEWLLNLAREQEVDAIVLAGDLLGYLDGFDTPEDAQRHEANWLTDVLEGSGLPVLYIMGNDDFVDLNPSASRVQSIHQREVRCGRFRFVGYQFSLPFMGGTLRNQILTSASISLTCPSVSVQKQYLCHTVQPMWK
jgi:Icc-related predicted phosphoesterase